MSFFEVPMDKMLVDAPGALMILRYPLKVFENFITSAKSPVNGRSAKSANEQLELHDGEAMLIVLESAEYVRSAAL